MWIRSGGVFTPDARSYVSISRKDLRQTNVWIKNEADAAERFSAGKTRVVLPQKEAATDHVRVVGGGRMSTVVYF